jgi:hypothetical protein
MEGINSDVMTDRHFVNLYDSPQGGKVFQRQVMARIHP